MIIKTFVMGMVLLGTAIILTELHRYMVYDEYLSIKHVSVPDSDLAFMD